MRFVEHPLPVVDPPPHAINFLGQEPQEPIEIVQETPPPRKRRTCFFCIIFFLLLLAGCVGIVRAVWHAKQAPVSYRSVTLEPQQPEGFFSRLKQFVFHQNTNLSGASDDRINVLLLGMGGPGHDGPYLTDTIIIASIRPSTKQVAMISIPRDLWVTMPGHGSAKINHANSYGEDERRNWGGAYTAQIIKENFGIDIHYYVRVDFAAFEEIIDEVGGIRVTVDRGFTDPEYPTNEYGVEMVSFAKGVQTMNGKRALIYARSRHGNNGEGSDFARAKRQQKMLLALKEKVVSFSTLANPVRLESIMKSLDTHITTNLAFSEMIELMNLSQVLDTSHVTNVVFDNSVGGYLRQSFSTDGQYILEPRTGNFTEMSTVIQQVFDPQIVPVTAVNNTPPQDAPQSESAHIEIQNGTWKAGLAARLKKQLVDKQFTITAIGNTVNRPQTVSGIYTLGSNAPADTVAALEKELQLKALGAFPPDIITASSTDILIVIGSDTTLE